jgi:hypothetical protein
MPAPHPRMHGLTHRKGGPDPIPGGDGIQFDIDNVGGTLRIETEDTLTGDPDGDAIRVIADTGDIALDATGHDIKANAANDLRWFAGRDVTVSADRDVFVNTDRDIGLVADAEILIHAGVVAGLLKLVGLPTTDPGVSNAVWNDSGTLKISP